MALAPGTRLGVYDITAPLGEGGMGQVWRATDTTLGRQVAIKILPDAFASDPERLARFEREAKTLASLNHPHIAAIYGFEKSSGMHALVMELVEGEDLSQRIARGAIPLDEALPIASQIAEALEAAHEQGIVHRDLKPANVKVRSDGTVKVLDFGLAKAMEAGSGVGTPGSALMNSPTITSPAAMTAHGIILGTAAYMAPEQAKGRVVDKRADIWAFGVVLHEMLTGRRLFEAEDLSETLAAVLTRDVSKAALPPGVPSPIRTLLRDCLIRDPRQRLRDIGDARIVIQHCLAHPVDDAVAVGTQPAPGPASKLAWAVAGAMALVASALAFMQLDRAPVAVSRMHLTLALADNAAPGFFALSPDGRSLVIGVPGGALAIRSLETGETRTLPGTAGYRTPFWSPDSRTVAFFAGGELKVMPASGGPPMTFCRDVGTGMGGTWGRTGTILLATEAGVMQRVSAESGPCTALIPEAPGQRRLLPVFLPDGEHFLYVSSPSEESQRGLYVASLAEPIGRRILLDRSSAIFVPDAAGANRGRLLFHREGTMMAQRFDPISLQLAGEPETVAEHVGFTSTNWQIAASADSNGSVMFVRNGFREKRLVWNDRSGAEVGQAEPTNLSSFLGIALAPDGKHLGFTRADAGSVSSLWTHDLERKQDVPLTGEGGGAIAPVWSPDSQRVAFAEGAAIKVKNLNGGLEATLVEAAGITPSDWSRDNRWLVYTQIDPKTASDIWLLADPSQPSPGRQPQPLLRTPAIESQAQISPDGKWMAYLSNESGLNQIYLRPFTGAVLSEIRWNISASSEVAYQPRWRADGRELFFLQRSHGAGAIKLMSVSIAATPNPAGVPIALFEFESSTVLPQYNHFLYSPAPDGQRFLMSVYATDDKPSLELILNWGATARGK